MTGGFNREQARRDLLPPLIGGEFPLEARIEDVAVETAGHTPGHTSYVLSSGSGKVFIQSDVTNNPTPFATNPGWHASFDQDGDVAEKTRRRVYDMVAAEKLQLQGFHYPFPGLAHI